MLDFAYLDRRQKGAQALRRYRERTGTVGRGHKIWTAQEDETLRRLYPNYRAMVKALPNRTMVAVRFRVRAIGAAQPYVCHRWTAAEISRMRRLAASGATRREIIAAFAPLTKNQVVNALAYHRVVRKKSPLRPSGHPALDAVRARCRELRLSMSDLDAMARTRTYFRQAQWAKGRGVNLERIAKAIQALGGTFTVAWDSDE